MGAWVDQRRSQYRAGRLSVDRISACGLRTGARSTRPADSRNPERPSSKPSSPTGNGQHGIRRGRSSG
ncbi:helicase associated domain-containing protein (plasmid) [Gordonia amicalis]|nr:helicase associated domain-containing protein [Gordonia amicalis]UOG23830.1 helicase associated domain-containing protein [Gordonia amicalis]